MLRRQNGIIFSFANPSGYEFWCTFIQYIKTLFNTPKAQIITNGYLSDAYSLSRGCRHPSSPGLFSLAIEPLAIAICSNSSIAGIAFGADEHKVALYEDDLILFLTSPINSLPALFQCLKEYSFISSYKNNYSKSEAFQISVVDCDTGIISRFLKCCPSSLPRY